MVLTLDCLVPLTFGQWTCIIEEQCFPSQIIEQIPAALTLTVNTLVNKRITYFHFELECRCPRSGSWFYEETLFTGLCRVLPSCTVAHGLATILHRHYFGASAQSAVSTHPGPAWLSKNPAESLDCFDKTYFPPCLLLV